MDLYAYSHIDNLNDVLKSTGVDIPRLRGLRLMLEEIPLSEQDIDEAIRSEQLYAAEQLIRAHPKWKNNACLHSYCYETDKACKKFLHYDHDGNVIGIRWDLIHGKHRQSMKLAMHNAEKRVRHTFDTFNQYAGRDDILCVHTRIGGSNWAYYNQNGIISQSTAFIEKIDDSFDNTYCDIYLRINPEIAHEYVDSRKDDE